MEALSAYRRALELGPNVARTDYNIAQFHQTQGDHQAAIEAAQRAISLEPNAADGYGVLGAAFAFLGDYDRAPRSQSGSCEVET